MMACKITVLVVIVFNLLILANSMLEAASAMKRDNDSDPKNHSNQIVDEGTAVQTSGKEGEDSKNSTNDIERLSSADNKIQDNLETNVAEVLQKDKTSAPKVKSDDTAEVIGYYSRCTCSPCTCKKELHIIH